MSESKLITFKSEQLRFSDAGFIRKEKGAVQAEIFSAGQAVERFEIDKLICVRAGCMTKHAFNAKYLHPGYPDDLLQNVLSGEPIFDGACSCKADAGFEQYVKGDGFDIVYRVGPEQVYFKDRANRILIKITDLPQAKPQE